MRRTALLAAILFLVAGAPVHAAGTPLFTAFKQFCLDTRLDMDAMRAALAAAGGRQTISAFPPDFPGQINEFWDLTFTGRPLRVTVSAGLDPGNGHRIQPTINAYCSVNTIMPWADTTSDAALAKWVGIPPTTHDEVVATYDYYEDGSVHRPVPKLDDHAYYALMAAHPFCLLTRLGKAGKFETVSLLRTRTPPAH